MKKHIRAGAVAAAATAIAWGLAAGPAQASSIEQQDPTVHSMDLNRATKSAGRPSKASPQLTYHGGVGGIGVQSKPRVWIVYWGSQWGTVTSAVGASPTTFSNDPKGVAPYEQRFFSGITSSDTWSASTTQYCQGLASGAKSSSCTADFAGLPIGTALAGVYPDVAAAAPSRPSQSDLAAEAVRAATALSSNGFDQKNDQIVISTATGSSSSGFGTQYCAWHSSTAFGAGSLAYTNLPYMPDAGGSCGAGYVTGGVLDGVSIVGGHEYAETVTDPYPNGGWLDSGGAENADKCAWKSPGTAGGAKNVQFATGRFPVQSLWSNNFNNNAGGCVISYTDGQTQSQY